ncbi:MAG: M2 family metallopeptidase [Acidobacteria bacterium]|nr:M2 family metallopeptidase [Acidobacteriota bacterium]
MTLLLALALCAHPGIGAENDADTFIAAYNKQYMALYYASSQAEWEANTRIVEGDTQTQAKVEAANQALAAFTGSTKHIEQARALLKTELDPLQRKQIEQILYLAANNPQTVPELVAKRIAAEAKQNAALFGFDFKLKDKSVSANDLDDLLATSKDIDERLVAWESSKEVGRSLKSGLADLVQLRNETVKALGFANYFDYQVSAYGMSTDEMMKLNRQFIEEVWPLYRELHTWARYELARKYKVDQVPELLPAHWLPNRWGQDWTAMVDVEGFDLDGILAQKTPEWVVKQAENFYVSLGFEPLPAVFYEKSSLYPLPSDAPYKKNNHASAWHMDLDRDVRSLMSVQPNSRWYQTTHHELGHIYYYLSYTRPEVPPLLREGANRGFHEAIGSLLGLASMQKAFLQGRELLPADAQTDEIQVLLKEALDYVVFLPWSAGVMTHFEHDLYADDLPVDQYNQRWWQYVRDFQGIQPPSERGEAYCDAATKTHINNDAAQYYDYAISYVLLHQFHAHIATKLLKQDVRNTNYFGSKETGQFLDGVLRLGATQDWRAVMKEHLGSDVSAKPLLDYFAPLTDYLKKQNEGRTYSLREHF